MTGAKLNLITTQVRHREPKYDPDWLFDPLQVVAIAGTASFLVGYGLAVEGHLSSFKLGIAMPPLLLACIWLATNSLREHRHRSRLRLPPDRAHPPAFAGEVSGHGPALRCVGDPLELAQLQDAVADTRAPVTAVVYGRSLFLTLLFIVGVFGSAGPSYLGFPKWNVPLLLMGVICFAFLYRLLMAIRYDVTDGFVRQSGVGLVSRHLVSKREVPLRGARVACDYRKARVEIEAAETSKWVISLEGMANRHAFVHTLFREALVAGE